MNENNNIVIGATRGGSRIVQFNCLYSHTTHNQSDLAVAWHPIF